MNPNPRHPETHTLANNQLSGFNNDTKPNDSENIANTQHSLHDTIEAFAKALARSFLLLIIKD
ncbi:hypothetical protein SAMN05216419_10387 [Nitrosomonas cryotolerans]|uniref:Uncharacterized protein n=1 Tax=Nitrosomonas cryotolerans ATCC 49181 TaxID=1131553 RepID=A0A1N6HRH5_9PROT|nr:hypothetical protein [Nitrosomonas cryotolerans]SFP95469.1 hypothetical protein SAMN05216419_10387 [Nitrosomonas cryotolerans]SIO22387.1 hypothetical protein SAMN02743940_1321 [Nitrosomonas cryotolerans ATCC 49181]